MYECHFRCMPRIHILLFFTWSTLDALWILMVLIASILQERGSRVGSALPGCARLTKGRE